MGCWSVIRKEFMFNLKIQIHDKTLVCVCVCVCESVYIDVSALSAHKVMNQQMPQEQ